MNPVSSIHRMQEVVLQRGQGFGVGVLLLAAGSSERMGDKNKLLLPLGDGVLLTSALRAATQCSASSVWLLTGFDRTRILEQAKSFDVHEIHNPDFALGQEKSLAVGLAALAPLAKSILVLLGDQPDISASLLDELIAAHCAQGAQRALVPVCNGRSGTPRILPVALVERAARAQGSLSLRELLSSKREIVHFFEVEDEAVLHDIDTPSDYHHYLKDPK